MGISTTLLLGFLFGLVCLFSALATLRYERRTFDWIFYLCNLAAGLSCAAMGFGMLLVFGIPWGMVLSLVSICLGFWLGARVGRTVARNQLATRVDE